MGVDDRRILPGATIGVLGGGQLGRMFAIAARELGYRIITYSPDDDTPAGQIGDVEFACSYEDTAKLREFAGRTQVVTFEFENIPASATSAVACVVPVRPDGSVLHIAQDRLREKSFLAGRGFPVTPFRRIGGEPELHRAATELGLPGVLKTATSGYDGKGQVKIISEKQFAAAWAAMAGCEGIFEAFVDFEKELSVVAARSVAGEVSTFPVFENTHADHILDIAFAPAAILPGLAQQAQALAGEILTALGVVGLLTVEMFLTRDGRLLVNELAPRPHNSGHLTIDHCVTSQFEQQVRAVCGLPLGSTELRHPAAMANLLGQLWANGEPNWAAALDDPLVKLHLYGKKDARIGRKMGHLTAGGKTQQEAVQRVIAARNRL